LLKPDQIKSIMTRLQVYVMILVRLLLDNALRCMSIVFLFLSLISSTKASESIPKWSRIEIALTNNAALDSPAQDIQLSAEFRSPSGKISMIDGFWDGGLVWRIRFSPGEIGEWQYATQCPGTPALHNHSGVFHCIPNTNQNRFAAHGPVKVANHGRALTHEDGTPFFWMADTAWNSPVASSTTDWETYLKERARQNFTTIQWTVTPWSDSPLADRDGLTAYSGHDKISINPAFFQKLDGRMDAINASELLASPVLLGMGEASNQTNYSAARPGLDLPEDQAVVLARYMVARWGANSVVWILAGNSDNQSASANRWQHIGQATFDGRTHAPVALLFGAAQSAGQDLLSEKWMDIIGYQNQTETNDTSLSWYFSGPQTRFWTNQPTRPLINLGPALENTPFNASGKMNASFAARRAMYWSLLSTPTAGVSYGNHAVPDWNDITSARINQSKRDIQWSWKTALATPAAEQVTHLVKFFTSIQFWRLRPAQDMLVTDPGLVEARRHIAAARTQEGDLAVLYVPEDRSLQIWFNDLPPSVETSWTDPRNGSKRPVIAVLNGDKIQFTTPGPGDWLLLLKSETK
jgi:hypothetical protein